MGFMLKMSICAKRHGSVVKSQLLRHSHATRHNHWHGSSPQKEKPRLFKPKKQLLLRGKHDEKMFFWFFLC